MDYENLFRQAQAKQSLSGGFDRTNQLKDRSKAMAAEQNQKYEALLKRQQQEAVNRQQAEQQRYQRMLNQKLQAASRPQPRETVRVNADGTTTWSGGSGTVNPNRKYTEAEIYQGMAANNGGKSAVGQGDASAAKTDVSSNRVRTQFAPTAVQESAPYGGQRGVPNYDWARADYQSVLNDPNATEAQRAEARAQREKKLAYMQDNDFRQLINDEMAKEKPNVGKIGFWQEMRNQKLGLLGQSPEPKGYNDSDYTQDFQSMYEEAINKGDIAKAAHLLQDRQKKIDFLANNDLKALSDEARNSENAAMEEYYNRLREQKIRFFANRDFTALAQEARENGDEESAKTYEALHAQKKAFLEQNDLEGLAQQAEEAGNTGLAEIYRQLREQKIQNGYDVGNGLDHSENKEPSQDNLLELTGDPYSDYMKIQQAMGDNTAQINKDYKAFENQIRNMADYNERMAESQYKYNEYKAQADADKNITAMYQKFYQEDLPAFKERIANYGLSAAGGLSRQENLMMQSALMSERNNFEVEKNKTIMEARMEADKLIAEGRMKEAEQVLQIGMKRLEAIAQEEQFNRTLSKELMSIYNDNIMKREEWAQEAKESQADRDFQFALQELKGNQDVFLKRVEAEIAEAKSESDLRRRISELSIEYGFKGDQEKLISELRKEEAKYNSKLNGNKRV